MAGGFGSGPYGAGPYGGSGTNTGGVTVTADLIGDPARTPQVVRVRIEGLIPGKPFHLRGRRTAADVDAEWTVWGSGEAAAGTSEVLGDVQAPLNVPVTYTVSTLDAADRWVNADSDPLVVPHDGRWVLQRTDGTDSVRFWWLNNGDPREQEVHASLFRVPGREHPVARVDVASADAGSMVLHTIEPDTSALVDLIRDGDPVLLRTDGSVWDLPMTDIVLITSARRVLSNGYRAGQNAREWTVGWASVGAPEPATRLPVATMAEFDAVWAGKTMAQFDAVWRTRSMADFDNFDWAREAAGA